MKPSGGAVPEPSGRYGQPVMLSRGLAVVPDDAVETVRASGLVGYDVIGASEALAEMDADD